LGFAAGDLDGKYFDLDDYGIVFTAAAGYDTYVVTVTAGAGGTPADAPTTPSVVTLNQAGAWAETQ